MKNGHGVNLAIITIPLSVPQHSALSFLSNQYKKRRVSIAKLIVTLVEAHTQTPDIVEPVNPLTNEVRDRKVSVCIRGKHTRVIKQKIKQAKGNYQGVADYIWQLVGQYAQKHVQTIELKDYEGKKSGREIK